jgi:predicted ATPase
LRAAVDDATSRIHANSRLAIAPDATIVAWTPFSPRDGVRVTENLAIGPFVLTASPRALRFGEQAVDLSGSALALLAAIARGADGASAAQLWPLVSAEPTLDEERLCDLVGDINTALGRFSRAWYVAWYPDDAVPRFALVDATRHARPMAALPARRTDIIGRDEALARIVAQLRAHRFVTILGAGGMGKTTVALAAAHVVLDAFPDGVHLVDLAPIVDSELVAQRVASVMGCVSGGADPLTVVRQWARERRALVILDSCEHVAEAASEVAEALVGSGASMAVLATSREPLRAAGEWLHRLAPMRLPQPGERVRPSQVASFSAMRLFVERASAADSGFVLRDDDVPLLASLCLRLDGIPLAIEIVAARVGALGLAGLAAQLEGLLLRLPGRRRAAPARHNTLTALLDWSFRLLSPAEQQVLRRLSVFRNGFTEATAVEVVADDGLKPAEVQEALLDLIAKSLVAPAHGDDFARRRLLDTTRVYAGAKLAEAGERGPVHARHARWLASALAEAGRAWNTMTRPQWVARYAPLVDDVRAALDWAFSPGGDLDLGAELAISGFALGRQMLLVDEFTRRVEHAIDVLSSRGEETEDPSRMRLSFLIACLGSGGGARLLALAPTLERAAAATADAAAAVYRFNAINAMWALSLSTGDLGEGATWAERLVEQAGVVNDPVARLVAHRIQAQTLHFNGRHAEATDLAQKVIAEAWRTIPLAYNPSPIELRVSMRIVLARAWWMRGFPDRAAAMAREAMEQARTDSPLAECQVLVMGSMAVALWSGRNDTAREHVAQLDDIESLLGFGHWLRWARRMRDATALDAGNEIGEARQAGFFDEPEPLLADHLATLDDRWLTPRCIQRVETGKVGWCAPEALRRQGERALRDHAADGFVRGEAFLQRALTLAREHGALAWELRAATSLARHRLERGRAVEARALLAPVFDRFTEGFETRDLLEARRVLEAL